MFWLLDIFNLSKSQVFDCFEAALEYEQTKDSVCCWYDSKSILQEDLAYAQKRAKEKFGIEVKYEISKLK